MTGPLYPCSDIFASLQGEGHFVGYPMVFVRLAGCSVRDCFIRAECDEAPWKAKETLPVNLLIARVATMHCKIACITGGEPTDHDLLPLIAGLRGVGMRVHMETSGVRSIDGWPIDWVTVSPKSFDYVQRAGHTLKVVVRPGWTWAEVARLNEGTTFFHRYLQPMTAPDGTSNLPDVIDMLRLNSAGDWALSTQAHKTWTVQ